MGRRLNIRKSFAAPVALGLALGGFALHPAHAQVPRPDRLPPAIRPAEVIGPGEQCRAAIRMAERTAAIPDQLLAAIGRVESGRKDPRTGDVSPWPWTVNAEGQGYIYETKAQAVAAVRAFQSQGIRSIDVGCLQVNLMHHPDAFASLDIAFDPAANAAYAARFLTQLRAQTGDWTRAAAAYHSQTPEIGADYQRKVLAIWPDEKRIEAAGGHATLPDPGAPSPLAAAWAATLQPGTTVLPNGPLPGGRVAVVLPTNRSEGPHIVPLAATAPPGRSLDSYRNTPIAVAARPGRIGG
jgi:hypothetical protein